MTEDELNAEAERMLEAALGGKTPHEALLAASRAESENAEERAAAKEQNRQRALKLLAALEKSADPE